MSYLIINTNPNPKSFCHAIAESVMEELQKNKKEFAVRDLYQIKFDPVLRLEDLIAMKTGTCQDDVKIEREYIKAADVLIFVFPVFMINLPAILKGYLDRVLSIGFGYKLENNIPVPLIKNKKALIFTTTHGSDELNKALGLYEAVNKAIAYVLERGCGIEVLEHKFFTSVPVVIEEERKKMLEEAREIVRRYLG